MARRDTEVVKVLAEIAGRGIRARGLLWRSHPDRTRSSEEANRDLAQSVNAAGGEVLLDERVRRAGSHHQKLFVVLHSGRPTVDVAFVGGIDLCHGRNDGEKHAGDPQAVVMDRRFGPTPAWHDVQAEIRGPADSDLAETFRERWDDPHAMIRRSIAQRRRSGDQATRREPMPSVHAGVSSVGTHAVQVLRTYPAKHSAYSFAPTGERSIAGAYLKALRRA